jgi:hypothetical protein
LAEHAPAVEQHDFFGAAGEGLPGRAGVDAGGRDEGVGAADGAVDGAEQGGGLVGRQALEGVFENE